MGGNRLLDYQMPLLTFSLSILLISLPCSYLEEMKDPVESSEERDSILTDSIQSKGKGMGEALTLTRSHLQHNFYLYAESQVLISGHSCRIKIHFIRRILSAVQLSVSQFHPPCLRFFFPHRLSPSPSLSRGCIVGYFGINVSARLWRLSVMNCLQTQLSDI